MKADEPWCDNEGDGAPSRTDLVPSSIIGTVSTSGLRMSSALLLLPGKTTRLLLIERLVIGPIYRLDITCDINERPLSDEKVQIASKLEAAGNVLSCSFFLYLLSSPPLLTLLAMAICR